MFIMFLLSFPYILEESFIIFISFLQVRVLLVRVLLVRVLLVRILPVQSRPVQSSPVRSGPVLEIQYAYVGTILVNIK